MSYLCSGVEGTDLSILLALSLNLIYYDDEHGEEKKWDIQTLLRREKKLKIKNCPPLAVAKVYLYAPLELGKVYCIHLVHLFCPMCLGAHMQPLMHTHSQTHTGIVY